MKSKKIFKTKLNKNKNKNSYFGKRIKTLITLSIKMVFFNTTKIFQQYKLPFSQHSNSVIYNQIGKIVITLFS